MEIRISLDRVEPPVGRLRVVPSPEEASRPGAGEEVPFTGWLGLLRALYQVVGPPRRPSPGQALTRPGPAPGPVGPGRGAA